MRKTHLRIPNPLRELSRKGEEIIQKSGEDSRRERKRQIDRQRSTARLTMASSRTLVVTPSSLRSFHCMRKDIRHLFTRSSNTTCLPRSAHAPSSSSTSSTPSHRRVHAASHNFTTSSERFSPAAYGNISNRSLRTRDGQIQVCTRRGTAKRFVFSSSCGVHNFPSSAATADEMTTLQVD